MSARGTRTDLAATGEQAEVTENEDLILNPVERFKKRRSSWGSLQTLPKSVVKKKLYSTIEEVKAVEEKETELKARAAMLREQSDVAGLEAMLVDSGGSGGTRSWKVWLAALTEFTRMDELRKAFEALESCVSEAPSFVIADAARVIHKASLQIDKGTKMFADSDLADLLEESLHCGMAFRLVAELKLERAIADTCVAEEYAKQHELAREAAIDEGADVLPEMPVDKIRRWTESATRKRDEAVAYMRENAANCSKTDRWNCLVRGLSFGLDFEAVLSTVVDMRKCRATDEETYRLLGMAGCRSVRAMATVDAFETMPHPHYPEIIFVGRSNVGKSSLVNSLLGQQSVASVSATPGHTTQFHFFAVNESCGDLPRFTMVDVPGLGVALTDQLQLDHWKWTLFKYLKQRGPALHGVFHLVNAKNVEAQRGLSDIDMEIAQFVTKKTSAKYQLVLTKADDMVRVWREGGTEKWVKNKQLARVEERARNCLFDHDIKVTKAAVVSSSVRSMHSHHRLWRRLWRFIAPEGPRPGEESLASVQQRIAALAARGDFDALASEVLQLKGDAEEFAVRTLLKHEKLGLAWTALSKNIAKAAQINAAASQAATPDMAPALPDKDALADEAKEEPESSVPSTEEVGPTEADEVVADAVTMQAATDSLFSSVADVGHAGAGAWLEDEDIEFDDDEDEIDDDGADDAEIEEPLSEDENAESAEEELPSVVSEDSMSMPVETLAPTHERMCLAIGLWALGGSVPPFETKVDLEALDESLWRGAETGDQDDGKQDGIEGKIKDVVERGEEENLETEKALEASSRTLQEDLDIKPPDRNISEQVLSQLVENRCYGAAAELFLELVVADARDAAQLALANQELGNGGRGREELCAEAVAAFDRTLHRLEELRQRCLSWGHHRPWSMDRWKRLLQLLAVSGDLGCLFKVSDTMLELEVRQGKMIHAALASAAVNSVRHATSRKTLDDLFSEGQEDLGTQTSSSSSPRPEILALGCEDPLEAEANTTQPTLITALMATPLVFRGMGFQPTPNVIVTEVNADAAAVGTGLLPRMNIIHGVGDPEALLPRLRWGASVPDNPDADTQLEMLEMHMEREEAEKKDEPKVSFRASMREQKEKEWKLRKAVQASRRQARIRRCEALLEARNREVEAFIQAREMAGNPIMHVVQTVSVRDLAEATRGLIPASTVVRMVQHEPVNMIIPPGTLPEPPQAEGPPRLRRGDSDLRDFLLGRPHMRSYTLILGDAGALNVEPISLNGRREVTQVLPKVSQKRGQELENMMQLEVEAQARQLQPSRSIDVRVVLADHELRLGQTELWRRLWRCCSSGETPDRVAATSAAAAPALAHSGAEA